MRSRLTTVVLVLFLALCSGCGEKGDKAIAYGEGLGKEWRPPAEGGQMRIFAENYFTRDVIVHADGGGRHFEMTVGPVRKRYMIVPEADYKVSAFTPERSAGVMSLYVDKVQENGAKGLHVKIRL